MNPPNAPPTDWQVKKNFVKERGQYLLETGMWSDCRFIVGTEPNQQVLEGHKLFLAMSSPVFEAMFFGGMAEKDDPIAILDVQPDAFKALLEYIYTDKINLTSFDQACELCYGAKKYMLPYLIEQCTKYLWSDLYPKNACRAYEFARLFEEPILTDKCINIIRKQTHEVLAENGFDDVELSTVITVLEQDELNINTELELFQALNTYSMRHNHCSGARVPKVDGLATGSSAEGAAGSGVAAAVTVGNNTNQPTIRDALSKIRFLTLTPQEFAEGPANSNLLTQSEKFAILMNICTPSAAVPMPPGFSTSMQQRMKIHSRVQNDSFYQAGPSTMDTSRTSMIKFNQPGGEGNNDSSKKLYCSRQLLRTTECMNSSVLDCAVTFTCDRNICVYGIEVPAQIPCEDDCRMGFTSSTYTELLYAHLLDADGSRLTYTHFTSRVPYRSLIEICFNRPVYIQHNKIYKVGVVLNKTGCYPIGTYPNQSTYNGVGFTFSLGSCGDSVRDGLIRSIIFSMPTNVGQHPSISGLPNEPGRMGTII